MADIPMAEDGEIETRAGEYVLGLLDPHAHAAARRLAVEHAGFAAEVVRWEARLTPLIEHVEEVPPPPVVWRRIAALLPLVPERRERRSTPRLRDSLTVWRGIAAAAGVVAAACLALVVMLPPKPAEPQPVSVARVQAPNGAALFVITYDRQNNRLVAAPTGPPLPADRSPELWVLPPGGAPQSLGLLNGQAALTLAAPEGLPANAALAVTLEPLGGAPEGKPTGPIIGQGALAQL